MESWSTYLSVNLNDILKTTENSVETYKVIIKQQKQQYTALYWLGVRIKNNVQRFDATAYKQVEALRDLLAELQKEQEELFHIACFICENTKKLLVRLEDAKADESEQGYRELNNELRKLNEKLNELKERQENCLSSNARFAELVTMLSQEFQEKFSKKEKPFCARCKERLKKIIW